MTGKENYPPLRYISEADCNFVEISTKGFIKELIKDLECMKGTSENDFSTITVKRAITQINGQYEEIEHLQGERDTMLEDLQFRTNQVIEQQAEIERLQKELSTATNHITRLENQIERLLPMLKTKRAEAIKEFAERLKDYLRKQPKWSCRREKYDNVGFTYDDVFFGIDKLVKEMVGDDK